MRLYHDKSFLRRFLHVEKIGSESSIQHRINTRDFGILEEKPRVLVANPSEEIFSMTEKAKKTTTAKARKPAVKKEKVTKLEKHAASSNGLKRPSHEEIEQLARTYWAERGYQDGFAEQDWLRAEQHLLKMAS